MYKHLDKISNLLLHQSYLWWRKWGGRSPHN